MIGHEIDSLIKCFSRLPGIGPRSARRLAVYLIQRKDKTLTSLRDAIDQVLDTLHQCSICGNFDTQVPCGYCQNTERDASIVCVVETVGDLWAMDRINIFNGLFHVLGGCLSAVDGVGPEDLTLDNLVSRVSLGGVHEVIIATNATVDGQITAHYVATLLKDKVTVISRLAHGVPVGGELDYLDDGTLGTALRSRQPMSY